MKSLPEIFSQAICLFIVTSLVIYYILKVSNQNILVDYKNKINFDKRKAIINSLIISLILTIIIVFISQQVDKQINLEHKNNT